MSAGCGEDEPPIATIMPWDREVARKVTVRGLVTDGESGNPVTQAEINLPDGEHAVTGSDGRFTLETTPGRKRVEVKSSDHLRFSYELVAGEVEFDSSIRVARRGPSQGVGMSGGTLVSEEAAIEVPPGAYPDGSSVSITALKRSRVAAVPAPAQFVDDTGTPRRVVGVVALEGSSAPAMPLRVRTPVAPDATMDTVLLHQIDGSGEWSNPKRPESIVAGMATFAVASDGQYGVSMDAVRSDARRIGYVVTDGGDSSVAAGSVLTGGTKLATGKRVVSLVDPRGATIEVAPGSLVSLQDPAAADGSGDGGGIDGGVEGTAAPYAGRVRALAGQGRAVLRRRAAVAGRILQAPAADSYKLTLALPTVTLAVKGTAFTFSSCTSGGGDMDTVGVVEGEVDAFYSGDMQTISAGQSRLFCPTCPAGTMPSCGEPPPPPLLARLGVSPSEVTFDDLPSGQTSPARTLIVTNLGNGPTGTLTSALGAVAGPFELQVNGCAGVVLQPNDNCAVTVVFKPTAAGAAQGEATVSGDPGGTANVTLAGRGLAPPRLSVSPEATVFDPQGVGSSGAPQALVVRNDGDTPTGALATGLEGTGAGQFVIATDGCAERVLAARAFCRIELGFRPTTVGEVEAQLAVSGTPGGMATATLRGRGLEPALLTASSREVAFGDQLVGTSGELRTLEVSNAGEVPAGALAVALAGGEAFELVENGCQGVALLPGGVCRLSLRFHPPVAGAASGSLALTADPGGEIAVALAGNGLAPAYLVVSPPLAAAPDTVLGATGTPPPLVFTNQGDVPTAVLGTLLAGGGAGEFSIASNGCAGMALGARASCSIQTTFQPTQAGIWTATVIVGFGVEGTTAQLRGRGLAPAALAVSAPSVGFGDVLAGTTSPAAMVTFTNPGDVPTGPVTVALAGAGAGAFAITGDGCGGGPLAPGASCAVALVFAPPAAGAVAAMVTASAGPGGTATAALAGRGLAPARLSVAPAAAPFGDRLVGSASPPAAITVTNEGDVASGPIAASLTGVSAPQYQLAAEGCQGIALGPHGTCTMSVTFAPTAAGDALAALFVSATPGDAATVALSGKGLAPAHLVVAPGTAPFADQLTGTTSAPATLTFSNEGDVPTGALAVAVTGAVGQFAVGSDGCSGLALPPHGACTIVLAFAPTVAGDSAATVTASGAPGGNAAVALSGRGLAPASLSASPAGLSFPDQLAGTTGVAATATFSNAGDVPSGSVVVVLGGASAAQFQIVSNGCAGPLGPRGACMVTVVFAPTAAGAASATLGVTASPGGSASVPLGGTGLAPAHLTVAPPSIGFGDALVGSTSAPAAVTVTNAGDVASGPLATGLSGVSAPQYQIVGNGCEGVALGAHASCTIDVALAPSAAGDASAFLFASATPGGTAQSGLTGRGLAPARIRVAPPAALFGDVFLGDTSAAVSLVVHNDGDVASGPLGTVLEGAGAPQFQIASDGCAGLALAAKGSCTVTVTFRPTVAGESGAGFVVTGAPGGSGTALSGRGLAPASLTVAPPSLTFGEQAVGTGSAPRPVSFTNPGDVATGPLAVALGGPGSPQYQIHSDPCSGVALLPRSSCTVMVVFLPAVAGDAGPAALAAAGAPGGSASASLSGRGAQPPHLRLVPGEHDLGSVAAGQFADFTFTAANDGGGPSGLLGLTLDGPNLGDFQLAGDLCSGRALAPGETCQITLRFSPRTPGGRSVGLRVQAEPGGQASALLRGSGREGTGSCTPTSCGEGLLCCDGTACADPRFDANHCGGCGNVCPTGQVCNNGVCGCHPMQASCDGVCSSLQDPDNCGACGNVCPPGRRSCVGGPTPSCQPCGNGERECGGRCVDVRFDQQHCGACGVTCGPNQACIEGTCASGTCGLTCGQGAVCCEGGVEGGGQRCTDLRFDGGNCGACGVVCGGGRFCNNGVCGCHPGQTECDGVCTFLQGGDADNCGACGNRCPEGNRHCSGNRDGLPQCQPCSAIGQRECGGRCVDTGFDQSNCGTCGNACGANQACVEGTCLQGTCESSCGAGAICCTIGGPEQGRDVCVDPRFDQNSCGGCGNVCAGGQFCQNGRCACHPMQLDCGGVCITPFNDPDNCGACGNVCPEGNRHCGGAGGTTPICQPCGVIGQVECNGRCADTSNDPANCGGCGAVCAAGEACVGGSCLAGTCALSCPGNAICCGPPDRPTCTDARFDSNNCGGCGLVCEGGRSCQNGTCACNDPGQTSCDGICRSLQSDPDNCGACGNVCPPESRFCSGGPTPTCQPCPGGGQSLCDGRCVDTRSDRDNCGACGTICGEGQSCLNGGCVTGTCQLSCPPGMLCCGTEPTGQSCNDPRFDRHNCGGCGIVCPASKSCIEGACRCDPMQTDCAGTCSMLFNDPDNCGACGTVCPTGSRFCNGGTCQPCSVVGRIECGGRCVETATDHGNCGGCGIACAAGQSCVDGRCLSGTCQLSCPPGMLCCGGEGSGNICAEPRFDRDNCGGCGVVCPANQVCLEGTCGCDPMRTNCGGTCAFLPGDADNCGACGNACPEGSRFCSGGTCRSCAEIGRTECGGACVDTGNDQGNCGACGNVCGQNQSCVEGRCLSGTCQLSCPPGMLCCGSEASGLSCNDPRFDRNNCGGCGIVCPATQSCFEGGCRCDPMQTSCDGICSLLFSDPQNCGACGNVCPPGSRFCSGGSCRSCSEIGQTECDGRCVDTRHDQAHCGRCASPCGPNQACIDSVCIDGQ